MPRSLARGAPAAWLAAMFLAQTLSIAPVVAETADSLLANRAQRPPIEWDTDRPGLDYKSFDLSTPSVDSCQISCLNDPKCVAWTYVNPGVQGPKARCWLKSGIPAPQVNKCCSSGIKKAPPIRKLGKKPQPPIGVVTKPDVDLGKIITKPGGAVPPEWADMLAAHNERRARHCVPPLTWSPSLAAAAQAYADKCILGQHGSAGENMADWVTIRNGQPVLPAASDRQIFENVWYCEINHYNFDAPQIAGGFKRACDPPVNGHFTQIVWKSTTQIGCGRATCNINGQLGTHWVCRYAPAGNSGALAENVLRPCK